MGIKHKKVLAGPDGTDNTRVQPSNWNDLHEIDELTLPLNTNPGTPAEDNVRLFGRKLGGRMMPAFVGPSGLDTSIQPFIGRNSVGIWNAVGNATTITVSGAAVALTATGTATAATCAVTKLHTKMKRVDYLVTTAATTAVAGWRQAANIYCREVGYLLVMRCAPATGQATTVTTGRCFMGVSANTAAPTDVAPSTLVNCIGVGYEGTDTTWFLYHNDASDTCTRVSLGTDFPRYGVDRASMFELCLFCPPGATYVRYEFTDLTTNKVATGEIASADQPQSSIYVSARGWNSVGGTSSVIGHTFCSLYAETDY